ncbi:MAG: peptidylprolyl isomerase, partial [Bacteroidota bacterium]
MNQVNNYLLFFAVSTIVLSSCSRPTANFTYRGESVAPAIVTFENFSEKAERFEWQFGDGDTTSMVSPEHRFMESGTYNVILTAYKGKKKRMTEKEITIDPPKFCLVEVQTEFGNMLIQLSDATPEHRDNFLKLAEEGFYDGLLFHRVINGFMVQGGDPNSKEARKGQPLGSGGPGYTVPAEFVDSLAHVKGAIAAARTGDQVNPQKRSSGSQFYIVQGRPVDDNMLNQFEARLGIRYSKE